ncbi:MAG: DUF3307 domain-containing protein [Lutibacter sp.]|jgi:hypothetical protein
MTEIIWAFAILCALHYIADFFIQVYAWKKSAKWIRNLIVHTIAYIFVIILGIVVIGAAFPALNIEYGNIIAFISINAVLHFITDFFTKKLGKILHHYNEMTAFINVVALDQCIHYITLIITFGLFFL